ncbi:MAG: hypothetical protein AAB298_00275, partial [Pseudomonadota bacterium]
MKFSENWLRTFVNPPLASQALADVLSMSGLDVEAIEPAAPPGTDIRKYPELDDQLFTIKPTPNRGDCLSVFGVAREVAAITGSAPVLVTRPSAAAAAAAAWAMNVAGSSRNARRHPSRQKP